MTNEEAYRKFWSDAYDEYFDKGGREMDEEQIKGVSTLNTWTDDKKAEARKLTEGGYWVHFSSTCIGHTLAEMVELNGIKWAFEEYGFALQLAKRKGWGTWCVRLR